MIPAGRKRQTAKQLVLGLDFGTAFTRVVIGDYRIRYAVPFNEHARQDNPYLLPSMLSITNGLCSLACADDIPGCSNNLKLPLIEQNHTYEDLLHVAAFLALVFRQSREWLLARYSDRYGHLVLSWQINAGLPEAGTGDNDSESELSETYRQVLHTAWTLSVLPGPVTLNRVRQYMSFVDRDFDSFPALYRSRIISREAIHTFTGCCGQICAYVQSPRCEFDLHMLIDVGAGTINIATFGIDKAAAPGERNRGTLYACAIEPLGVHYLLERRYDNLKLPHGEIKLFEDIPDLASFAAVLELSEKEIRFADVLYTGEVARLINRVLDETRQYCPDSPGWEAGVATFVYGGGARLETVQGIIHSQENKSPPHQIRTVRLNPPDDLIAEQLPPNACDRLSMAYGLSFEAAEIAQATRRVRSWSDEDEVAHDTIT